MNQSSCLDKAHDQALVIFYGPTHERVRTSARSNIWHKSYFLALGSIRFKGFLKENFAGIKI